MNITPELLERTRHTADDAAAALERAKRSGVHPQDAAYRELVRVAASAAAALSYAEQHYQEAS